MEPEPPTAIALSAPDRFYAPEAPSGAGAFQLGPDGAVTGVFFGARYYPRVA